MQQPPQMIPLMPSFPPSNITTEQIQKFNHPSSSPPECSICKSRDAPPLLLYLDENKKLILAILDNQNLGKLADCAQYQAQLQKNLMYLAAIADAQPQAQPTMPPQMTPHPGMQQGGYFMQHQAAAAAAAMAHQQGMFPSKVPLQFGNPHQMLDPQQQLHLQHQQTMQGQMGMRLGGTNNGMHTMHADTTLGGGSSGGHPPTGPNDARGGSKQDASEAGTAGGDGNGDGESS